MTWLVTFLLPGLTCPGVGWEQLSDQDRLASAATGDQPSSAYSGFLENLSHCWLFSVIVDRTNVTIPSQHETESFNYRPVIGYRIIMLRYELFGPVLNHNIKREAYRLKLIFSEVHSHFQEFDSKTSNRTWSLISMSWQVQLLVL